MCGIRKTVTPIYSKILSNFPQKFSFCFAYGSGVKVQIQNVKPSMIDFVYCVENANKWHEENLKVNSNHYSFLKFFGYNIISKVQENSGARVYFNTLVNINDVVIKYGVVSRKDLITDLLEWSDLYLAGRLHKPVEIIKKTTNAELQTALQLNLQSAVHAALLLLPETFTEYDFYYTICNLSYGGDFRMIFGENKNKVSNIVKPQLQSFRKLYSPMINLLHDYVEFPTNISLKDSEQSVEKNSAKIILNTENNLYCKQDISPAAKLHHLNQLPRWPQKAITRFWNRGTVDQDTEDVLRAIAYDPDCGAIVDQCIKDIVWRSSLRQSLKGIITAGVMKIAMISDEESSDSDSGVRFKTTNTRDKYKSSKCYESQHSSHSKRSRSNKYDSNHISSRSISKDNSHRSSKKYSSSASKETDKSHYLGKYKKHGECKSDDYITNKKKTLKTESKINDNYSTSSASAIKTVGTKLKYHSDSTNSSTSNPSLAEEDNNPKPNSSSDNVFKINTCNKVAHSEKDSTTTDTIHENVYFGPTLPPKLNTVKNDNIKCNHLDIENTISSEKDTSINLKKSNKETTQSSTMSDTALKVIGPTLPEHLRASLISPENNDVDISEIEHIENECDSDDDIIGPLPVEASSNAQLEERALQIKLDLLNKSNAESTSREEWMLELPPVNSVTQVVGKRKFRTKEMPDLSDRSSWTDTAQQKAKKKVSTDSNIKLETNVKDVVQEKIVEKHKKNKRNKSLVDLHNEAQKIKMTTKPDINERRPFSRDIDLKTNHMNEAQTKAVIKKAQLLDNRFSSGQSKFL